MDFTIQVQKLKKLDTLTSHVVFETEIFEFFIIFQYLSVAKKLSFTYNIFIPNNFQ